MEEPHPLAVIHDAVFEFLRGRTDVVLFGAQAVNAYVKEPRMTQDVDVVSVDAERLADDLRRFLHDRFGIAARVWELHGEPIRKPLVGQRRGGLICSQGGREKRCGASLSESDAASRSARPTTPEGFSDRFDGLDYRVYQRRKPKNRHLCDVRSVDELPPSQIVDGISVMTPARLIAEKVTSHHHRRGQPKSFTDLRDVAVLFLEFPELQDEAGRVRDHLMELEADAAVLRTWSEVVAQEIHPEDDAHDSDSD